MVLQKRLDYGFNGYEVPHTPRAARSPRKSAFKKKSENHQISSFDLLAAVAGKLLLEGGNSSSSSNNASGNNEDIQCPVKKEPLHGGDHQMVGEETNCDHDNNNAERSFFVSEILPKAHEMQISFDRSPSPHKDFHFGSTSGITSDSSDKFETQDLAYEETKIDNSDCYRSESNDKKSLLGGINFEAKLSRNVVSKDENYIGSGFRKPIPHNPSVSSDDIDLLGKENDNGENFSARYTTKSFRSTLRIGDRRIRKVLASKYCKVTPKPKDTNSDLNLKPDYYSKKHCHRSLRSERNYPIKKRRYFDGYNKAPQSEETAKNHEGLSGSPPKASAFLSSIACQKQPAFQSSRDSNVKLGIKSFRVPELFIEIPENATVGSLKRTVLEAVTTILGGGLRIGVLVHGKKIRDDNKMLLQTGISLDTLSDSLGFCLEPNPPQSTKPLSPEDSDFQRPPCNVVPHPLTRCLPSPGKHAKPSNSVESDLDSKPSAPNRAKTIYSRALIPVPPLHAQALTVVPPRKTKRSEVAQRRIRRPFSVAEVEALVQAVERLGTGRWRDVKLRAFDNAKHRTYVDLKDKWKTLVHTARISPQQRRGEPVPQELLDRVLTAHAYWSQQQGKHQLLEEPQRLETSLGL